MERGRGRAAPDNREGITSKLDLGGADAATTREELSAWWRAIARRTHPDHGGNAADFIAARHAYVRARSRLPRIDTNTCHGCRGAGRFTMTMGFVIVTVICPVCLGSGKLRK